MIDSRLSNVDALHTVCKIEQGADCCKYLVFGSGGGCCLRLDPDLRETIDAREDMHARAVNCTGWPRFKLLHDAEGLEAGATVYLYTGQTFGVCSEAGVTVTVEPGEYPFFELDEDSLELLDHTADVKASDET